MTRTALRVLSALLTTVGTVLFLPTAINIGTGGKAPDWLQPFVGWLWPIGLVCAVAGVALELIGQRERPNKILPRRPQDPRNLERALAQVERYVEERQRASLTGRLRIALALDERPAAVRQPVHLVQRVSGTAFQLSAESDIAGVFSTMDESMLLLGAPGAGKTTQLLDLAAALVARARTSDTRAVPVVVDLAAWSRSADRRFGWRRRGDRAPVDFLSWLLRTLERRFHIPEAVGRAWLQDDSLIVLMDGLDEVREADRERCVWAINDLQERHGVTRLAVCSRVVDYHKLTQQLKLQGAVEIRLLTRQQVDVYLRSINPQLSGVATVLAADEELWELLTTPLMLTIMVIAEEGRTVTALAKGTDAAERRRLLFDAYVVEVLARRRASDGGDPARTLAALGLLASASVQLQSGVRVVDLNDTVGQTFDAELSDAMRLWLLPVTTGVTAVVPVIALMWWVDVGVAWCAAGLGVLVQFAVVSVEDPSRLVRARAWPMLRHVAVMTALVAAAVLVPVWLAALAQEMSSGAIGAIAVGIALAVAGAVWLTDRQDTYTLLIALIIVVVGVCVAASAVLFGVPAVVLVGWAIGFGYGLCTGTTAGLLAEAPARIDSTATDLQRVQMVVFVVATLTVPLVLDGSGPGSFWPGLGGWLLGIAYGFIPGVFCAYLGLGVVYVRSAMAVVGKRNPWRPSFLSFAVDRSLLTYVDGEYRFVHLLVRDHLAACRPASLARAVLRRRAELSKA